VSALQVVRVKLSYPHSLVKEFVKSRKSKSWYDKIPIIGCSTLGDDSKHIAALYMIVTHKVEENY
jgi:hypothetical protein